MHTLTKLTLAMPFTLFYCLLEKVFNFSGRTKHVFQRLLMGLYLSLFIFKLSCINLHCIPGFTWMALSCGVNQLCRFTIFLNAICILHEAGFIINTHKSVLLASKWIIYYSMCLAPLLFLLWLSIGTACLWFVMLFDSNNLIKVIFYNIFQY